MGTGEIRTGYGWTAGGCICTPDAWTVCSGVDLSDATNEGDCIMKRFDYGYPGIGWRSASCKVGNIPILEPAATWYINRNSAPAALHSDSCERTGHGWALGVPSLCSNYAGAEVPENG